ncbi:MAG: hypothetical protein IV091_13950 [Polaromonas sp.]|jgi:hypothetical protein|nr:hypothetical protein [Polaromonas sp.]
MLLKIGMVSSALLDYPLTDYVMEGARQGFPLHEMAEPYTSWAQARDAALA